MQYDPFSIDLPLIVFWGPRPLGPRRNRWAACVSRQSFLATDRPSDYWLTAQGLSLPSKNGLVKPSIHNYKPYWLSWVVIFMKHILNVMTS